MNLPLTCTHTIYHKNNVLNVYHSFYDNCEILLIRTDKGHITSTFIKFAYSFTMFQVSPSRASKLSGVGWKIIDQSYSHKTLENELCTHILKSSNKNPLSSIHSVLIGQFWSMRINLVLKKFYDCKASSNSFNQLKFLSSTFYIDIVVDKI